MSISSRCVRHVFVGKVQSAIPVFWNWQYQCHLISFRLGFPVWLSVRKGTDLRTPQKFGIVHLCTVKAATLGLGWAFADLFEHWKPVLVVCFPRFHSTLFHFRASSQTEQSCSQRWLQQTPQSFAQSRSVPGENTFNFVNQQLWWRSPTDPVLRGLNCFPAGAADWLVLLEWPTRCVLFSMRFEAVKHTRTWTLGLQAKVADEKLKTSPRYCGSPCYLYKDDDRDISSMQKPVHPYQEEHFLSGKLAKASACVHTTESIWDYFTSTSPLPLKEIKRTQDQSCTRPELTAQRRSNDWNVVWQRVKGWFLWHNRGDGVCLCRPVFSLIVYPVILCVCSTQWKAIEMSHSSPIRAVQLELAMIKESRYVRAWGGSKGFLWQQCFQHWCWRIWFLVLHQADCFAQQQTDMSGALSLSMFLVSNNGSGPP